MMLATLAAVPFGSFAPLLSRPSSLVALLGVTIFFASIAIAINPAATMAMMPARMRGVAAAFGVLIVNLVGLGCGPLIVALLTDVVFRDPRALSYSLAITAGLSLGAATGCLTWCRFPYERSLALVGAGLVTGARTSEQPSVVVGGTRHSSHREPI